MLRPLLRSFNTYYKCNVIYHEKFQINLNYLILIKWMGNKNFNHSSEILFWYSVLFKFPNLFKKEPQYDSKDQKSFHSTIDRNIHRYALGKYFFFSLYFIQNVLITIPQLIHIRLHSCVMIHILQKKTWKAQHHRGIHVNHSEL